MWSPGDKSGPGLRVSCGDLVCFGNGGGSQFLLDLAKLLSFRAKLLSELEGTTDARLIRIQPALSLFEPPALLAMLLVKAIKPMLQP